MAHAIFTAQRAKRRGRIALFCTLFGHIAAWRRRRHDRQWLERLDERALRDLGLDRDVVDSEGTIPFWSLQSSRHTML